MKNDIKKNGSGYYDPTAFKAIINTGGVNNMEVYKGDIFYIEKGKTGEKSPAVVVSATKVIEETGCAQVAWLTNKEENSSSTHIEGNAVKSTSYDSDGSVITGYELSSVITINIDGKEIQSCGDTCIFEQNGLNAEVNFTQEDIQSQSSGAITDNTIIAGIVNKYKNSFGKSRVVVIKSQLGQPITAYSGDKVYWKIPQDLPKMTKLMIDGKALYIHRANFQIIDKELLK